MKTPCYRMLVLFFLEIVCALEPNQNYLGEEGSSRILSRRKRFLIFPDGSSFQLVFCTQNMGYIQIGDIVWFGNTAALAWELPTDPDLLLKLKKHDKLHTAQNRDGSSKLIYYLDAKGNVLSKVPYRKRPIVNPAFAKRSVDEHSDDTDEFNLSLIQKLHTKQKKVKIFDDMDAVAIDFHRDGRQSFYGQLEMFIQAGVVVRVPFLQVSGQIEEQLQNRLGWTGRECILRLLCESGKDSVEQGSFLEEIFRATFTFPKDRKFNSDLHRDYDEAHRANGDCVHLYQQCKQTVK